MAALTKVRHDLFPDESTSADDNDFHGCPLAVPSVAELQGQAAGAACKDVVARKTRMAALLTFSRWSDALSLPLAFRLLCFGFRLLPIQPADGFIAEGLEPFPPFGGWVFGVQELACRAVEQGPPVWLGKPEQGRDG